MKVVNGVRVLWRYIRTLIVTAKCSDVSVQARVADVLDRIQRGWRPLMTPCRRCRRLVPAGLLFNPVTI